MIAASVPIVPQETMPKTTMLIEVFHGVREILWDEFDDDDGEAVGLDHQSI